MADYERMKQAARKAKEARLAAEGKTENAAGEEQSDADPSPTAPGTPPRVVRAGANPDPRPPRFSSRVIRVDPNVLLQYFDDREGIPDVRRDMRFVLPISGASAQDGQLVHLHRKRRRPGTRAFRCTDRRRHLRHLRQRQMKVILFSGRFFAAVAVCAAFPGILPGEPAQPPQASGMVFDANPAGMPRRTRMPRLEPF
jgi:hypothetical protein